MPGKVKVKIISGRNLPVMDRSSDTTDAYVEIKLGSTTYKTDVCRKSLHPHWNSDWYRFEVDDSELQDEPLQIRLMDHDTYSANDAIGKVYLDLNPLLLPTAGALPKWSEGAASHENTTNAVMSGWIPVYDTMHGIRGEVNIVVKVELFSDFNKFRQSSCGVQFFCLKRLTELDKLYGCIKLMRNILTAPVIPHGYFAQVVHGFVEELVVNDDPEYQWIDKIRTPRASNEARQTLFFKLSGELQRKIGLKALDLGGNAVIGYTQSFDLEGESGIVARGIGTAVTLLKLVDIPSQTILENNANEERAQNYLKFLGSAKGFFLNTAPGLLFKRHPVPPLVPSPAHSVKSLKLEDRLLRPSEANTSKIMTRHLSDREFNIILRPPTEMIHHSASLQTLLKQEDMRGTPGRGITQKFKNLRFSSQNMLSKKMTALKAKLSDSGGTDEGNESADTIDAKKRNAFKYRRTQSDSTGMAEILVRSVFHAASSLDCITEAPLIVKTQSSTEQDDVSEEENYLSLPDASTGTHSSNEASSSSDSSSLEEDDVSDAKDNSEPDTVSNIVETVRKLSMIHPHPPINVIHPQPSLDDVEVDDIIEDKLLFVVEDDFEDRSDDEFNTSATLEPDELSNEDVLSLGTDTIIEPIHHKPTLILPPLNKRMSFDKGSLLNSAIKTMLVERINLVGTYSPPTPESAKPSHSESFFPHISRTFQGMKKSPSVHSFSDRATSKLGSHFTSLHDIHGACSKVNKYSAHQGKETVLGHLFKRLDRSFVEMERAQFDIESTGTASTISSTVDIQQEVQPVSLESPKEKHGIIDMFKEGTDKILHGPKVLFHRLDSKLHKKDEGADSVDELLVSTNVTVVPEACPTTPDSPKASHMHLRDIMNAPKVLFHRLDSKIHKKDDSVKQEGLLHTALGNVLMDSVNEVLVTSSSTHTKPKIDFAATQQQAKQKPNLKLNISKTPSEQGSTASSTEHKSGFFKDNKLFRAFKRLDSKIHKKSKIKDEGLLGTALGNVLMDSVNEVLATSSPSPPTAPANHTSLTNKIVNTELDNSNSINTMHACLTHLRNTDTPPNEPRPEMSHQRTESMGTRMSHSPAKLNSIPCILRRSSDSDLSITPKGNSLTGSDRSGGCSSGQFTRNAMIRSTVPPENFDIMEYPFLTMSKYPTGFIAFIGGAVSARSVKLLERITNIEEPESRDTWWSEIRMEIRSHARALNCNAVLGYTETTSICEDVCVLSASGTSAIIGYQYSGEINDNVSGLPIIPKTNKEMMTTSLDRNDFEKDKPVKAEPNANKVTTTTTTSSPEKETVLRQACNICHLPYVGNAVPLRNSSSKCNVCRTGKVPDVLIATIEMPEGVPSIGRGCFLQSYVCRPLRDLKGESNAKEISDGLPFLEYELHRLLINKLKVKGMNSIFGLKVRISIGERMLIGIATGTAVFLSALPPPPLPKLVSDRTTDEKKLAQLQKSLHDTVKKNKEIYQLKTDDSLNGKVLSDTDDSEDDQASLDLSAGNKDCCILEVDDPEDVDVLNSLMEPRPPDGFHVVNTELVPGLEELEIVKNLQMFTQIWRAKIQPPYSLDKHFHRLLQSVYFKLRRMIPCALCDLQFRVDSPEPDEIQLCVLGMALGLGDPQKTRVKRKTLLAKRNDDELIFNLEEDLIPEHGVVQAPAATYLHTQTLKHRQKSPIRSRLNPRQRHVPYRERHGVDITPLSYVPGGKIEKYLGNLNFFFIRETTSIREEGGLSGFVHSFITEILAIVRAHVTALGGNAMVAYFITECVLNHNLHKNQGQCLINVGGDVVYVTYYSEDH